MGLCISMPSSNSKVNPRFRNPRHFDVTHPNTSTPFHPNFQGAKSSSDVKSTSRRTVITSTGVSFRSMDDLLEEVNRQLMMLQQRR
ncbi:AC4 [Papaya leaf curl virus]|uniref:AC4 n=1 Tax=Papaya leaf curl virus TaxID=53260 RepID=Q198D0_9GEMI|nr:AC4 [Papaya leaf curl virus]